jgi:hypothetical protein
MRRLSLFKAENGSITASLRRAGAGVLKPNAPKSLPSASNFIWGVRNMPQVKETLTRPPRLRAEMGECCATATSHTKHMIFSRLRIILHNYCIASWSRSRVQWSNVLMLIRGPGTGNAYDVEAMTRVTAMQQTI